MKTDLLQTPCLLVDKTALEGNLQKMANYFDKRTAKLRPHFKSHKCTEIAKRQLAAGNCVGITCATLHEAQVLVDAGITDILLANQLTDLGKLDILACLNKKGNVKVCVDCVEHVELLSKVAKGSGVKIGVLVELDVGMGRCGVQSPKQAVELAQIVEKSQGLVFEGIQAYEGHTVLEENKINRTRAAKEALCKTKEASELLIETFGNALISSGGTGTFDITGNENHVSEIQAGSYALMDAKYKRVKPEFQNALFVLTSCISTKGDKAIFDVGVKGCGQEFCNPEFWEMDTQPEYRALNEEHFVVSGKKLNFKVGDRVRIIPGHGCTTCNLHENLHLVQDDDVLEKWSIEG